MKAFDKAMHVHAELTRAVAADPDLHSKASNAFRSFVRAYSTHCKSMKAFFHVKQLHLGHVAHSFGLRCAEQQLLLLDACSYADTVWWVQCTAYAHRQVSVCQCQADAAGTGCQAKAAQVTRPLQLICSFGSLCQGHQLPELPQTLLHAFQLWVTG